MTISRLPRPLFLPLRLRRGRKSGREAREGMASRFHDIPPPLRGDPLPTE
ncbi:MAG: hypothetical protein OJF61_002967 [Rhodanobacteraceae bacterium]|nr:MAG: hypothetical protein OJF61_002967 [Rhodanobacteraceae bacterium]